jgi:YHS domain-containing protein
MRNMIFGAAAIIFLAAVLSGCFGQPEANKQSNAAAKASTTHEAANHAASDEEHGHKASAHGGILVSVGRDNYHAEAVFEKGGKLRLYMLGQDEMKVQEVESQMLTAYVKAEGDSDAASVAMKPEPQPGDKEGMTSQFLVQLPKELAGKRLEVTIPSLRIGGERFRIAFKSNQPVETADHGMPSKVGDAEEQKLYLTAGGKYTEADIKANGGVVASAKFKGLKAEHDLKPKAGDKICPVTLTKANPKFSWVIGGKSYQFCCPPCIQEFVSLAKEKPAEVQDPEFYRMKPAGKEAP